MNEFKYVSITDVLWFTYKEFAVVLHNKLSRLKCTCGKYTTTCNKATLNWIMKAFRTEMDAKRSNIIAI